MLHTYAIKGEDTYVIETPEKFNADYWNEFRQAYLGVAASKFRIDMAKTVSIDSSALAMLIMLRDHVGSNADNIELVNVGENVAYSIRTACFDRLFTVVFSEAPLRKSA